MVASWQMEIYWQMPIRVQEWCLSAYARRLERRYYGPEFTRWCQLLKDWEFRSAAATTDWQVSRLREILRTAVRHVPYYRHALSGIDCEEIKDFGSLRRLPLLEKDALREAPEQLLDDRLRRSNLFQNHTSGSTGTPIVVYWAIPALQRYWAAAETRVRAIAGVSRHLSRAMMGGRPILRGGQSRPPYWRYIRYWRELYLSSVHVSGATAGAYAEALRSYGVRWLTGFGSSIAALATACQETGVSLPKMDVVLVSGDTLQPGMRQSIERAFDSRCVDNYGMAEGVCMAVECDRGAMHLVPEVGVLEILREDGAPCEPGEVGELVATGLLNDAMPLIRYRTGDYAAWSRDSACPCGRPQPMIQSLQGRVNDYLVTEDGRRVSRIAHVASDSPTVHSSQLVQDRPGHAYLLVRPGRGYRHADGLRARDDIRRRVGRLELELIEVAEIPRTRTGKTQLVVRLSDRPETKAAYEKLLFGAMQ